MVIFHWSFSFFHPSTSSFSPWKCHPTSHHLSFFVDLRADLSVIWRMGLQHRGQSAWCSGRDCYSNFHHDLGPRATHPAKVKLPGDTWQKELKPRTLQGNTEVSKVMQGQGKRKNILIWLWGNWICGCKDKFLHSPTVKVSQEHSWEEWNIVVTVGRSLFIKAQRNITLHKCC